MSKFTAWAKETTRKASYAVTRKTPAEKAVLEATNDEKWGPSNTDMQEIARMCQNYKECEEVRSTLWARLGEIDHVRYVQKSLLLLEYLLRNGPESFRSDTRQMLGQLQSLTSLHRYDVGEEGALEAVVRKKSEDIIAMVNDNETYEMERQKAAKLRSNLTSASNVGGYNNYSPYSATTSYSPNNNYDNDNVLPSRKTTTAATTSKPQDSSDYEYDDDFDPNVGKAAPAPAPARAAPARTTPAQNQGGFNPFASPQVSAPQQTPQNGQQFDPFGVRPGGSAPAPAQPAFNNNYNQNQQFNQFVQPTPPAQNQNTFNAFGAISQPNMNQNYGNQNSMSQNYVAPAMNADDLLFGPSTPAAPAPARPQAAPAPMDDFMDLSTPSPAPMQNAQYGQQPIQNVQAQRPVAQPAKKPAMMDDLGGLVDFNLQGHQKRDYGKAGNQVRGGGPTLGSK